MKHYYPDVPGLGNVAVSRHAQTRCEHDGISQEAFEKALLHPSQEIPDGLEVIWRDRDGVRVVILMHPVPFKGAKLVKTAYRIQEQARVK